MGDDGGEGGTPNVEYCSGDGEEGIDEENVNGELDACFDPSSAYSTACRT